MILCFLDETPAKYVLAVSSILISTPGPIVEVLIPTLLFPYVRKSFSVVHHCTLRHIISNESPPSISKRLFCSANSEL